MAKRKTHKEFLQEVYNLVGDEYTVLGEYVNTRTKILIRHNICSHEYEIKPKDFIAGCRCPKCYGNNLKTTEQFKQEVYELVSDEYSILSEYKNNKTKILMKHNTCSHEFYMKPNDFQQGQRCPLCNRSYKKTTEQFKQEVYELVGDEYSILSEYISTNDKITIKHNVCKNIYITTPNRFLQGFRCPRCKESKGEKRVAKYLYDNNVKYKREYKFSDCKNIHPLPFDFYIESLNICIEYDGKQHYLENVFGRTNLKEIQFRDNIKTQYCLDNNIKLIRIPYTHYDHIEEILKKEGI